MRTPVLLAVVLTCFMSADVSMASTAASKLVMTGRLTRISKPAHCGVFFFGAVAEYSDLHVIAGKHRGRRIFVVHGCPELSRRELGENAGTLPSFKVGDRHRLELTSENVLGVEVIVDDGIGVSQKRFFASHVELARGN